jgi:hypothetical protein
VIWLLSLAYAGTTWRWASEPCTPLDGSAPVPHLGGLEVDDLEETTTILEQIPELRSVPLALPWPRPGVSRLVSGGHDLAAATGELSLWDGESDYADRLVLIRGRLNEPQYGGPDEPVRASLEELPYTDTRLFPDASAFISLETWPTAPAGNMGRCYPQIAGLPGHITGRAAIERDISGSVAPKVAADLLLLAGHSVLASSVTVYDSSGTSATVAVSEQDDGMERRCSMLNIAAAGLATEDEYGIAWPTAGGRPNTDGAELQGAGQVILWALAQSGIRVDWGQVRTVAPLFDWLIVVVDIEAQTSPWEWVSYHILPLLPVSVVSAGGGIRLIPWRFDAIAEQATYHLRVGAGVIRDDLVTYEGEPINSCTVTYARNAVTGNTEESVTVCGYPEDDDRQHGCKAARLSQDSLRDDLVGDDGVRAETIEALCIASERAAVQVAMWRVNAFSVPRRSVSLYLTSYLPINLGDVVLLTDDEADIDASVCLVASRTLSDRGDLALSLLIL